MLARTGASVAPADDALLGDSAAMHRVRSELSRLWQVSPRLLLRGELGTGKTLAAHVTHARYETGSLVVLDCTVAELEPEQLSSLQALLVGPPAATLLMEEIGLASAELQTQLQTLLDAIARADTKPRLIATSRNDLGRLASQRALSAGLLRDLERKSLWLPPLRARLGDVELLATAFCARESARLGRCVELDGDALVELRAQRWPGNVRQLRDLICALASRASLGAVQASDVIAEVARMSRRARARGHAEL